VQSLADYYSMLLAKGHRRTMPERPPVKEPLGSEGMPAQMPEGP